MRGRGLSGRAHDEAGDGRARVGRAGRGEHEDAVLRRRYASEADLAAGELRRFAAELVAEELLLRVPRPAAPSRPRTRRHGTLRRPS